MLNFLALRRFFGSFKNFLGTTDEVYLPHWHTDGSSIVLTVFVILIRVARSHHQDFG